MAYEEINWTVSKNIQDTLWQFIGTMNKEEIPDYFKDFRVFSDDHNGVERCVWNNDGDTAKLYDASGNLKHQLEA